MADSIADSHRFRFVLVPELFQFGFISILEIFPDTEDNFALVFVKLNYL